MIRRLILAIGLLAAAAAPAGAQSYWLKAQPKTIPQLAPAAPLTGTEIVPLSQGGVTLGATMAQLGTYLESGLALGTFGYTPLNSSRNLSDLANVATARTNLGLGALATLSSIPAIDVTGLAASATIDATNASNISSGTLALARLPFTPLSASSNLSDLANVATARSNLGLGALATLSTIPVADVSGLAPSATIDATNASNISSGTLAITRLPFTPLNAAATALPSNFTASSLTSIGTISSGVWQGTPIASAYLAYSTISGVSLGGTLGTLAFGTHLTGTSYNGSAGVTLGTDAATANTPSTLVARDASGNFSAGTITAALTGHASLDLALTGGALSGPLSVSGSGGTVTGPATLTISSTNDGTTVWASSALDSALVSGHEYIHLLGEGAALNNSGYFGFHYSGTGSAANYMAIGMYGDGDLVTISGAGNVALTGSGGTSVGPATLGITTTTDGPAPWASASFDPFLSAGHAYLHVIGESATSLNAGYFGFHYVGAGSASNFMTIGFYGDDNILTVTPGPGVGIGIGATTPLNMLDIGANGGIHIYSGVPGNTGYALYNNSGTLTWNGTALATGSSVSGTTSYLPKFTGPSSLGNSGIYQSGANMGIGTTAPSTPWQVAGNVSVTGGSPTTLNLMTSVPANGVWDANAGPSLEICPMSGCQSYIANDSPIYGNHYSKMTANGLPIYAQYNSVVDSNLTGSGTFTNWAAGTSYAAGVYVLANNNIYVATTAGTSASSGSGPSGEGSAISDGTAQWNYAAPAYEAQMVGEYNDVWYNANGPWAVWGKAVNLYLSPGHAPGFAATFEFDLTNTNSGACAVGVGNCYGIFLGAGNTSSYPITAGISFSGTNYMYYGILANGDTAVVAQYDDDSKNGQYGFCVGCLSPGVNQHSSADFEVLSHSGVAIQVSGAHAAESYSDLSASPAAASYGGSYSLAALYINNTNASGAAITVVGSGNAVNLGGPLHLTGLGAVSSATHLCIASGVVGTC